MISIKKSLKTGPEFILPQTPGITLPRSINRGLDTPVGEKIREFYLLLPLVYVRAMVCVITLVLAIGVGAMIPWLAELLERVVAIIALILLG
jgi:hypothetical protein